MFNEYKEHEAIVKEVVFDFIATYGSSDLWTDEVKSLLKDEIKRRIEESI